MILSLDDSHRALRPLPYPTNKGHVQLRAQTVRSRDPPARFQQRSARWSMCGSCCWSASHCLPGAGDATRGHLDLAAEVVSC